MARNFASTDVIDCGTSSVLSPSGSSATMTISAWIRPTSLHDSLDIFISRFQDSTHQYSMSVMGPSSAHPNKLRFDYFDFASNDIEVISTSSLSANIYYHCAGVALTGNALLYLNGVLDNSVPGGNAGINAISGNTIIGHSNSSFSFLGAIADVAIWNTQLTSSEIAALAAGVRPYRIRRANLVAYYPLEGTASPEPDVIGGNNGTLTGTASAANPYNYTTPKYGSRSFNGSSDAITANPGAVINGASKLAISFWLNWTTFASNDALAMEYSPNYNSNTGGFVIDPNGSTGGGGGKFEVGLNGVSGINLIYFTRPSAGSYHHYLINFDGTNSGALCIPSVYVDGVSQSLSSQFGNSASCTFGNYSLYFMSRNAASLFGTGSMVDLAIYSGINLTAAEAARLAQGYRPYQVRPSGLVAYWPLAGTASPEPDQVAGNNGTLTGTSAGASPTTYQDIVGA